MGLWPFRRKSKRRLSPEGSEDSRKRADTMRSIGAGRDSTRNDGGDPVSSGPERRRSRRDGWGKRKSSRESKKLQRDPQKRRTYSFSPGRDDDLRVVKDANRPPVPPLPANFKGKGVAMGNTEPQAPSSTEKPVRAATQPAESTQDWQRVPTLHKRAAQDLPRRKSSKKRKEDHDREAEIKAMTAFIPVRPAVDSTSTGRPIKRESKSMRGGLNRNLENPSSDISLPLAESIHSSLSSHSNRQTSYKLSPLDLLAPRPTIRYSENPRYGPTTAFSGDRTDSRRRRISERAPIPEETLKAHKRIDELADDLDASDLRELMERDQKRRERKKLADKQKMEKKLARRQEKQRLEEATAVRDGTPPPPNLERGVLGRELVGLGIGTSAVVTSTKRKGSNSSDRRREKRPADGDRKNLVINTQEPSSHFQSSASLDQMTPGSEHSEPVVQTAKVGTVARASMSPPSSPRGHARGASSISQMIELSKGDAARGLTFPPKPEPPRRQPESGGRKSSSWTSFFKRASRKQSDTPSSFSNTSRDSMLSAQPTAPAVGYTPIRASGNIPKRTMSRFREDLPELPISPPDSRVQSPEADVVPPILKDYQERRAGTRTSGDDPRLRYDTPTSGYRSLDDRMRQREETPSSANRSAPSPEPVAILSQSLASIDSEGSWLSGRPGGSKRGSARAIPKADSASTLQKQYKEYSESAEELGIAEDEYFSRLTPGPDDAHRIHRQSTGNPVPSSDEEDDDNFATPMSPLGTAETRWGAVARQPTVVHRGLRAKSREGLLNEFDDESGSEMPGETPQESTRKSYGFSRDVMEEEEEEGTGLQRATSVDLGTKHVRHISAGSAKLLDLKPRASGEGGRRVSSG